MEKEVRGDVWENDTRGFEQRMLEEDRVRVDWNREEFKQRAPCKNSGIRMHGIKSTSVAKHSAGHR